MPSEKYLAARQELELLVDAFARAADGGDFAAAEHVIGGASPEARMMFWSNMVTSVGGMAAESPESIREQVSHLMNAGRATVAELLADVESMSIEGQGHALFLLQHHPSEDIRQFGRVIAAVITEPQ